MSVGRKRTKRTVLPDLRTEAQIQRDICAVLDLLHVTYSESDVSRRRNKDGIYTIIKGTKGWQDLTAILAPFGQMLAIEVKSERGLQRKEQKEIQKRITRDGGIYLLARNANKVYSFITRYRKAVDDLPFRNAFTQFIKTIQDNDNTANNPNDTSREYRPEQNKPKKTLR